MNLTICDPVKVLVADDQPDVLEALQLLLKNEGFVAELVNSPDAVVHALERDRFDLLLIDMNYARDTTSGCEGLELLQRIRAIDSALPVVVMTAWGNVDLAVESMQTGGRDFIQKPWDNKRLIATLRRHVVEGQVVRDRMRREQASLSLTREVAEAKEIQEQLLSSGVTRVPGCDVRATWRPANGLGGDYFDVIPLNHSTVAFCIADVCGKGVPAALVMAQVRATVRVLAPKTARPSGFVPATQPAGVGERATWKVHYDVLRRSRHCSEAALLHQCRASSTGSD